MSDKRCICVDMPLRACLLHGEFSEWRKALDQELESGPLEYARWNHLWDQFDSEAQAGKVSAQADLGFA